MAAGRPGKEIKWGVQEKVSVDDINMRKSLYPIHDDAGKEIGFLFTKSGVKSLQRMVGLTRQD